MIFFSNLLKKTLLDFLLLKMSSYLPLSMRLVGLEPGFTHQQWEQVMERKNRNEINLQILYLAYQEWENEQSPQLDGSPWRWYLSYLGKPPPEGQENSLAHTLPDAPPNTPIIEGIPTPPNMSFNELEEAMVINNSYTQNSSTTH